MGASGHHAVIMQNPFSYQLSKSGRLLIYRSGRCVKVVKGTTAERLLETLRRGDEEARQLALARATGQYKFGNERAVRRKSDQ